MITQDSAFKDKTSEELNIIIKADVHGSKEAIEQSLQKMKSEKLSMNTENSKSYLVLTYLLFTHLCIFIATHIRTSQLPSTTRVEFTDKWIILLHTLKANVLCNITA